MLRIFTYIFIALVSFLIFMVVLAPAGPIWGMFSPQVNQRIPDLRVLLVRGTIWDGSAELQYRLFPTSYLNWDTRGMALLGGSVETLVSLAGDGHDFKAHLEVSSGSLTLSDLNGELAASYINAVSEPQGLTFSGEIDVNQLKLVSDFRTLTEAGGNIHWNGGKVVSRTSAVGTQVFDLPALDGDFSMQGEDVVLDLHHESNTIVDIRLKPTGWVTVKVKARLFELAGLPWPSGTSLTDTVLEFEEKVL